MSSRIALCAARRSRSALSALLVAVLGCNSATVHVSDGPPIDGEIVDGDAQRLIVRVDGQPMAIPRERIEEVDHPGNVAMVVGGVMLGISAAMITVPLVAPSGTERDAEIADLIIVSTGVMYGVAGLAPLVWGGASWLGSRQRAAGHGSRGPSAIVTPTGVHIRF